MDCSNSLRYTLRVALWLDLVLLLHAHQERLVLDNGIATDSSIYIAIIVKQTFGWLKLEFIKKQWLQLELRL